MSDHEHVFATPGPAGLMVLAFYLGCLWPVATKMAPHDLIVILVPLGLAGAIVQTLAGVIELRNGAILPGNIMMAFSAFMWYGFGEHLLNALGLIKGPTAGVDGIVFLIMGLLMTGFTPCFFLKNTAATLFMIATDVFFLGAALFWITGMPLFWTIAGWDLPFVILFILWQVIGDIINACYGRVIVPMGPPWAARKAA
jgi:succinate-acetate transporter protein